MTVLSPTVSNYFNSIKLIGKGISNQRPGRLHCANEQWREGESPGGGFGDDLVPS